MKRDGAPVSADKQQVLARIARQRQRLAGERAERLRQAQEAGGGHSGVASEGEPEPGLLRSKTVRLLADHPVAASVLLGAVMVAGPGRLLRWSSWLLPLVLRWGPQLLRARPARDGL